jgi:hypothetical protein
MLTGLGKNNIICPKNFFYIRQGLSEFYPFTPLLLAVYPNLWIDHRQFQLPYQKKFYKF